MPLKQRSVLPGFGVAMGFTLVYLSVIVLLPLAALCLKTATLSWGQFLDHREGVKQGWEHWLKRIAQAAAQRRNRHNGNR